jgi:hypothetical protein
MSEIETLLPVEKIITVNNKKYTITKMTLAQNIKLLRLIGNLHESVRQNIINNSIDKNDLPALLEGIATENADGLLKILLKSDDDFSNISMEDFSEVIKVVTELNDFEKIFANFQQTTKNLKGIAEKIKGMLSLPSSQK